MTGRRILYYCFMLLILAAIAADVVPYLTWQFA
jgi:hypothetical protein